MSTTMTNAKVPRNLIDHFAVLEYEGIELSKLFKIERTPVKEKFIRKYAAPAVSHLPPKARLFSTNMMKRFRNPSRKLRLNYPLDFEENRKIVEKIRHLDDSPWWHKKGAVCLCHDVDTQEGNEFVREMAKLNLKYQIPSTFNFLTNDCYKLDFSLMRELTCNGIEIALHGYSHDQGFAYRSREVINEHLRMALEQLAEFDIVGYRSPALCLSKKLFAQLQSHGLHYDSSLQVASPFYRSVRIPYPYFMEEYGVWELPLMVQDDNYFRDTDTSDDDVFKSIHQFLAEIILLNGVFVLNIHPHAALKRPNFYVKLLQLLSENNDIACSTMRGVIEYCQDERMSYESCR